MITHQLSLKGKAAADIAEVAEHLNITHDVRDAENAGGMQSYNGIHRITRNVTECVEVWIELIKSRSVHLNRLALWTSIYKY